VTGVKKGDVFGLGDKVYLEKSHHINENTVEKTMVQWQGERRSPRKGEWYISGAIPVAYLAPNDFSTPYLIGVLVKARFTTTVSCRRNDDKQTMAD